MAISQFSSQETRNPVLLDTVDGFVDHQGQPVRRASSGGWRSACFIIGVEVAERFAYYGISSNLITFLTGPMGQSVSTAAANVNAWSGTAFLLPLLGAFIADSFLGRYRTIITASIIYILHGRDLHLGKVGTSPVFKLLEQISLIHEPEECKAKSSFFNWWFFCIYGGTLGTFWVLNYIQDNLNWGLGFGIPCIVMVISVLIFVAGTKTYRYSIRKEEKSALQRIFRVFVVSIRNWRITSIVANDEETYEHPPSRSSEQFNFLDKALIAPGGSTKDGEVCSWDEVNEAKALLRLVPI